MENMTNTEIDEKQSAAIYGGRAEEGAPGADEAARKGAEPGGAEEPGGAAEPGGAPEDPEGPEDEEPGMWQPVRGFLEGRRPSVWE